jgi:transcriptional regulator NrdR family protein
VTYTESSKLPCPLCGSQDSRTLKTRWYASRQATWRRRECIDCRARFSTHEILWTHEPTVRMNPGVFATKST